jgi:aspartyl-tRNA synthetase
MTEQFQILTCGQATRANVGQTVELRGWIHRRRDHGGLIFLDLRDHNGLTQLVAAPELAEAFSLTESLRNEDVVRVRGTIRVRPEGTVNDRLATGEVELAIAEIEVLARSQTPPFQVTNDDDVDENIRLRYRYLDLRRTRMQHNLRLRHRIVKAFRDFYDKQGFIEVETPLLIKSTPEGARDYLVPSRIHRGEFYALPQSPQLLKQILMIVVYAMKIRVPIVSRNLRNSTSRCRLSGKKKSCK